MPAPDKKKNKKKEGIKKAKKKTGKNTKEIKLPKPKHVQILRSLALRIINSGLTQTDHVNGEIVHYAYGLAEKMSGLGYDPKAFIPQMAERGYLVVRSSDPEPESYYICTSLKKGHNLKLALAA